MSADRTDDGDTSPVPDRLLRAVPALDRNRETQGPAELPARNETRDRGIGELAEENAALYKRIDALESRLEEQQAKFSAWARAIAIRDDQRDAREEARAKREETLADRIAELEHRLTETPATADPGGPETRLDRPEPTGTQTQKRNPARLLRTNEAITTYVSGGAVILTAAGDAIGTSAASDVTSLIGSAAGFAAAAIALARARRQAPARREDSHADRPEG